MATIRRTAALAGLLVFALATGVCPPRGDRVHALSSWATIFDCCSTSSKMGPLLRGLRPEQSWRNSHLQLGQACLALPRRSRLRSEVTDRSPIGPIYLNDSGLVLFEGSALVLPRRRARRRGGDSEPVNFWLGTPSRNGRYRYTQIVTPRKFAIYDGSGGLIGPYMVAPNGNVIATGNCNLARCGYLGTFLFKRLSDGRYAQPRRLVSPIGGIGASIDDVAYLDGHLLVSGQNHWLHCPACTNFVWSPLTGLGES